MNIGTLLLKILDYRLQSAPVPYGVFHIISLALSFGLTVALCVSYRKDDQDKVRRVVFAISACVVILEVFKQLNYSAGITDSGIDWTYQWYAFPWQFCSMPMIVGVLQGIIKKGKIHNSLCAFLATYAVFAGTCVMFYPGDVFTPTLFICIQTMICHGTMFPIGTYLIYTGHVKTKNRVFLGAMAVFAVALTVAVTLNEVVYSLILPEGQTFNMFFVSRHFNSTLPVYSSVHSLVPFPLNIIIYFVGFSAAAYLIFLGFRFFKKLVDNRVHKPTAER